jgi:hypothetical protein
MERLYKNLRNANWLIGMLFFTLALNAQDDRGGACWFGNYNANYTTEANIASNFLLAFPYQGYSGTTITHLCMKGNNTNSGVQLALYGDNNGAPGAVLGYTALHNVTNGDMILPISPVNIASSGQFWIAMLFENEGSHVSYSNVGNNPVYYMSYTYGTGVPPTFNTTLSYTGQDFNLWAAAAYVVEEDVNSCGPYTLFGQTYATSQTADTFIDENGCYSFITTNINIFPALNLTVTQNGNTLAVNQVGTAYQWVDCNNNNAPIAGATSQSFTPTVSGSYAVKITTSDCIQYSSCMNVSMDNVGLENNEQHFVNIFPNPANNVLNVELKDMAKIQILSLAGQVILDLDAAQTHQVDLSSLSQGVYFVRVNNETMRFVKQ